MAGVAAAWRRFLTDRLEFRALGLIIALGGAILAFLGLSDEVGENATAAFDRAILLWFRNPANPADPIGSRAVEEAMRDVTALGGVTLLTLFVVIAAASLLFFGKWRQAVVLTVTIILAEVCNDTLKVVYDRPRPELVPHGVYVYTHSFPSGHSMLSAATYLTVAAILSSLDRRRRFKAFVFTLAILVIVAVGVSRVYLGVHWPTDVLAGWTLGAAWALLARLVLGIWRGEAPAAGKDERR
ncbi:phosphatase PAP2 family protein [Phenylobacterium sp.]|jgi:undecaprenyl-diphosphatase|uniref:phosphatase PAP2 family protein n=1 Tax=Phenylobacterium sp. TaxID=1871053 RepID=UPI002F3E1F8F